MNVKYMSNKILVWRLRYNGETMFVEEISDILEIIKNEIQDLDEGETIQIKRMYMSTKRFIALPEFEGL